MNVRNYILLLALTCTLTFVQACDVIGDSAPSESKNFVLDSLRIIQVPDTEIVINRSGDTTIYINVEKNSTQQNQVSNADSGINKKHNTQNQRNNPNQIVRHKHKRQGDIYPIDFIQVQDFSPKDTKHIFASKQSSKKRKQSHNVSKRSSKVSLGKVNSNKTSHAKLLPKNEQQKRKSITFKYSSSNSTSNHSGLKVTVPVQSTQKQVKAEALQKQFVQSLVRNSDVVNEKGTSKQSTKKDNKHSEELETDDSKLNKEITKSGQQQNSSFNGKVITICITGVDSRLGVSQRHADANHVLKIWLDKGIIDIYSVPRGTPVNAGFSSKSLNYLANLRSNKGRDAYLRKMEDITGCGKIDYWMELGFSQAMGVMEMLGFKDNAKTALRVIRSRKAFATGDYQRCYNQGQFIRQMILRHFGKSTGFMGGVALRSAVNLVETNLKFDVAKDIIQQLEKSGFPKNDNSVMVKVRPSYKPQIQNIDLWDDASISVMNSKLENKLTKGGYIGKGKKPAFVEDSYENKLESMIKKAERVLQKNPKSSIALLRRVYEQRSWIQISDKRQREIYFERICKTLIDAYERSGFIIEADNVKYFYDQNIQTVSSK